MLRADYLVLTVPKTTEIEAAFPFICAYWMPDPVPYAVYGYKGYRCGKFFLGEREDRVLLQVTGSLANDVALRLPFPSDVEVSVARIDVQCTIDVRDADFLIRTCEPSPVYKACRWSQVRAPGETLYVGAPSSEVRLRLYNKTAQSGVKSDGGFDFLRVELQFRNRKADQMFRAFRARAPRFPFLSQLKRMVDPYTYQMVYDFVSRGEQEIFQEEEPEELDLLSRRKAWLERCVLPALKRVLAEEPEYLEIFLALLDNPREETYNNAGD